MIDILLINPNNRILSPFAANEPPLWLGLMASHYRDRGQQVAVIDAEALDMTDNDVLKQAANYQPAKIILVVMGNNPSVSSTPKMVVSKSLALELSRAGYRVAFAGLHPSAMKNEIENELGFEVLVGKVFDGTPDIPYDLYPMERYVAHNWHVLHDGSSRRPYGVTYTSLGCPFNCEFCNIHSLYGDNK